ncbi:MAG: gamma-glutamyl-gamma-aminobutyrate hydrolase family protein [Intestinibacillus sp.]
MKKPVILLSCGFQSGSLSPQRAVSAYYGTALAACDALSAAFSGGRVETAAERFDGLLLTGGGDLAPSYYGQSAETDTLSIDPARDREELSLLDAFIARGKPVFGICRGVQVLNVYFGGTLLQHMEGHGDGVLHEVRTLPGSRLHQLCGPSLQANSYHHQAVAAVGLGLRVTARAADGVIEGLEHHSLPVFGVQWHPERQTRVTCMDTLDDQDALFAGFAALCAGK